MATYTTNYNLKKPADSDLLSAGFPLRQKTSAPDGAEVFCISI